MNNLRRLIVIDVGDRLNIVDVGDRFPLHKFVIETINIQLCAAKLGLHRIELEFASSSAVYIAAAAPIIVFLTIITTRSINFLTYATVLPTQNESNPRICSLVDFCIHRSPSKIPNLVDESENEYSWNP